MSMKSIAVIPARYASTRFPGKLLMNLGGKTIIQHVWERTKRSKADDVLIAVDDQRVFDAARAFGAEVVMTSPDHPSGSDRIWEAVQGRDAEAIINVQGDEPFVKPQVIDSLIDAISADDAPDMATVVVPCPRAEYENNPNMVKVVMTADNFHDSVPAGRRRRDGDLPSLGHLRLPAFLARQVRFPAGRQPGEMRKARTAPRA